jgi:uncharacterized membrane-anchored protein
MPLSAQAHERNILARSNLPEITRALWIKKISATTLGGFLADSSGLGFGGGALLIAGAIALIAAAYYLTGISRVALFWMAFALTRPLGAKGNDLLTKPVSAGGLNLGAAGASAMLQAILLIAIGYIWQARRSALQAA